MSRGNRYVTKSMERPSTNEGGKTYLLTVPEYKAFRDIPDESPESRSKPQKENYRKIPSPNPFHIGFSTPSASSIQQRYRNQPPSCGTTHFSAGKQFLFNTPDSNKHILKQDTFESQGKKLQSPESIKPYQSIKLKLPGKKEAHYDERTDPSLEDENESLKQRVLDLSLSLLEDSKFRGYDEFYIRTLIQQKDYFEKEMKAAHEIIKRKENEIKELADQSERRIASLVNEINIWKEKAIALERVASTSNVFDNTEVEALKRELELKDREIAEITHELRLRDEIAHNKLKFLSKEIERMQSFGEDTENTQSYGGYLNESTMGIEETTYSPQRTGKIGFPKSRGMDSLGLVEVTTIEDSLGLGTFHRCEEHKPPAFNKFESCMTQNAAKYDLLHILLMIEVDRLHTVIDNLAKIIDNSNMKLKVSRD